MSTNAQAEDELQAPHDEIAQRAYEISQREDAGTPEENWARAERELADERGAP
jgi:hypothetical protein